ncbi:putative ubiquitin carboxyl-terminal hydrolase [Ochromonadaceae sp. CCMP2298]|nr:putative ubiquitin carboxyl-terminal hydrolase [Ochromonadaceae sp. CCMP2298]
MPKHWFPLESNPDVMNTFVEKMGLNAAAYSFTDVLSTEDWALEMVPQPIVGVLMLFPIKPASEEHRRAQKEKIEAEGQVVSPNVYYMQQTIGNACGTVGILHAIGNAQSVVDIVPDSYLDRLFKRTAAMSPADIASYLEADDELDGAHSSAATAGQSEQQLDVDTHFVCFTQVDGHIYELDGRKSFPINHGESSPESLLPDACRIIKEFMDRDPGEVKFTIVALSKTASDF